MEYIDIPIDDMSLPNNHTIYRYGFAFTSIRNPIKVLDAIIIRNPSSADCQSPKVGSSSRTLAEHIELINQYQLKRALVIADDIRFLRECPSLQMLDVIPAKTSSISFDYSPLYDMPNLISVCCCTQVGDPYAKKSLYTTFDYGDIPNLQDVSIGGQGNFGISSLKNLKSLMLNEVKEKDLSQIIGSEVLDSLYLLQSKMQTLTGIERTRALRCVSLEYCRALENIDALQNSADTLTRLQINNCPKIQDFSVLSRLYRLEYLALYGKNTLPNLDFIREIPNLKTFLFSMEILNGDLRPCMGLSYVYSERNKRYYNVRENVLPKKRFYHGMDGIDEWRQHF